MNQKLGDTQQGTNPNLRNLENLRKPKEKRSLNDLPYKSLTNRCISNIFHFQWNVWKLCLNLNCCRLGLRCTIILGLTESHSPDCKSDVQGVSPVFSWFSLLSSPGVTSKKFKLHSMRERCLHCWVRCIEQDCIFTNAWSHVHVSQSCAVKVSHPWITCFKDQTFMSEIPSPKSTEFLGDLRHLAQQQRIGVLKELHPKPQMLLYPTSWRNIFCSEPWWILEG